MMAVNMLDPTLKFQHEEEFLKKFVFETFQL